MTLGSPLSALWTFEVKNSKFKEPIERACRQASMEQVDRAWLIEVTPSRAYAQHYIARSSSAEGAIEAVKKFCWLGELNKARTEVLGHLSHAATLAICGLYKLPVGGVLPWPHSKIELLGVQNSV